MGLLRYITAGESHGKGLNVIIEGVPSNLSVSVADINKDLVRRQKGYGRGGRMRIEKDAAEILSGIRAGKTLGSPISIFVENKDWSNWSSVMCPEATGTAKKDIDAKVVTRPRPGHADLSGAIKYNQYDIRNILERSSARETSARVAAGSIAKKLISEIGIQIYSWVVSIGDCASRNSKRSFYYPGKRSKKEVRGLFLYAEESEVSCPDKRLESEIIKGIDIAKAKGDSLGGIFEVVASGVPVGLGSHVQWDRKLNAKLTSAVMSIQAIKGVEVGLGFEAGLLSGSEVHDEIQYNGEKFSRKTNNAGGIEGGMSNGEDIVLRATMKPIPTLYKPLKSVDIKTKKGFEASIERSDICAVPAAAVIGEAVVAIEIASAVMEKFGGDSIEELKRNYKSYLEYVNEF